MPGRAQFHYGFLLRFWLNWNEVAEYNVYGRLNLRKANEDSSSADDMSAYINRGDKRFLGAFVVSKKKIFT